MSHITVYIKNMAGDLTSLEVPTGTKVEDIPARLTEMDRELYPPYCTRVFRSTEEEKEEDTILREEDMVSVLILPHPEPETGVFPQGGKPYTRFVLRLGERTIYLYVMSYSSMTHKLEDKQKRRYTEFAVALSPEVTKPSTTFLSQMCILYDAVQDVIHDISPSEMRTLYDVVNPYYERLGLEQQCEYIHEYNPQEPIECECGSILKRSSNMVSHKKTKKHIAFMKSH